MLSSIGKVGRYLYNALSGTKPPKITVVTLSPQEIVKAMHMDKVNAFMRAMNAGNIEGGAEILKRVPKNLHFAFWDVYGAEVSRLFPDTGTKVLLTV